MTIFFILALYLIFIRLLCRNKSPLKETILCAIGFILVLALRSPYNGCDLVGSDSTLSNSYYGTFIRLPQYNFRELLLGGFYLDFEVGFLLYSKLVTLITVNFQWYLAITAVIQIVPLSFFFYKYSPNITLAFFIFGCLDFFSFYFSGLRQSIAISIGVLAIHQLISGNVRNYLLLTVFASLFHMSAIFLLMILAFYKIKLNLVRAIILCIVIILTIPILRPLLLWISSSFLSGAYEGYLESGGVALTMFVVYMMFFLFSFIYKKDSFSLRVIRWFVLIGVFFQSFGAINNGALTRGGYYFLICLPVLLPYVINSFHLKNTRNVLFIVAIFLLSFFFILTVDGPRNVVPYYFFWDKPL
jgi:hypothetical protein